MGWIDAGRAETAVSRLPHLLRRRIERPQILVRCRGRVLQDVNRDRENAPVTQSMLLTYFVLPPVLSPGPTAAG